MVGNSGAWNLPAAGRSEAVYKENVTGGPRKLCGYVYPILRENPRFGPVIQRLKNWDPPTWRYRVGDWQFFYEIDEDKRTVFMTADDDRKTAFR